MTKVLEMFNESVKDNNGEGTFDTDVTIKYMIDFEDMLEFVEEVVANAFDSEGEYIPAVIDYMIKRNVIRRYSDIELPDDVNEEYSIIYQTDMFEQVSESINKSQLNEIINSIDHKIEHLRQSNIRKIEHKLNELIENFEELGDKVFGLFKDVNPEDMEKMVQMFSGDKVFDEKKIVKAYIDEKYSGDDAK